MLAFDQEDRSMEQQRLDSVQHQPSGVKLYVGWGVISILVLLVGWNACRWNREYYQEFAPFYDSMSYHAKVYESMTLSAAEGPWKAFRVTCFENTTNSLPYVIGALIGPFINPSRQVGIWIQVVELWLVACSVFYYFNSIRGLRFWPALLLLMPLFFLSGLYHFHGGLQDFRMDLSLMLMFMLTIVWYLISCESLQRKHFVLLGIAAGCAMLFRATAPIYLGFALGPCVAWDLAKSWRTSHANLSKRWRVLVQGWALSACVTFAVSGWFFILNWKYLYYYYAVWNVDALAKLPWRDASKHFEYAFRHIGTGTLLLMSVLALAVGYHWLKMLIQKEIPWKTLLHFWRGIDLRLFWIGLAPAFMLTIRGAGLNPFVAMPSAIGCWLAASSLFFRPMNRWRSSSGIALVGLIFLYAFALQMRLRPSSEFAGPSISMVAYKQILQSMVDHAAAHGRKEVHFGTSHVHLFLPTGFENVIAFDMPGTEPRYRKYVVQGIEFRSDHTFSIVSPVEWEAVSGGSTADKIATLVDKANSQIDYLVLADAETADLMVQQYSHIEINKYCQKIRECLLASGNWEVMSGPIVGGRHESAHLYYNKQRMANLASRKDSLIQR